MTGNGPAANNDNEFAVESTRINAIESISRAEIDMAIATSRRFPRNLTKVKQNLLSYATLDEETAAACFYTLPRGGKNIQGPSVRLAEIAVSCYGNIRAGARVIQTITDGPNPHVVVQAVAMDLENNVHVSIEKRRRITKKKNKTEIDEDDINLASNAGSAIAFRDAVFKIVPMALIKPTFEQCRKVAIGDAKSLVDRRNRMVETFGKMGVTPDRVLAKVEKKSIEEIGLDDIETLLGLFNAIKEGEVVIEEAFPLINKTANAPVQQPVQQPANVVPLKKEETKPVSAPVNQAQQPAEAEQTQTAAESQAPSAPSADVPKTTVAAEELSAEDCVKIITGNAAASKINIDALYAVLKKKKVMKDTHTQLSEISTVRLQSIVKNWAQLAAELLPKTDAPKPTEGEVTP